MALWRFITNEDVFMLYIYYCIYNAVGYIIEAVLSSVFGHPLQNILYSIGVEVDSVVEVAALDSIETYKVSFNIRIK